MKRCLLSVALRAAVLLSSFAVADSNSNSCQDKCGAAYDGSLQCQCNDRCSQYNNCCGDYSSLCTSEPDTTSTSNSCQDKCGAAYDRSLECQCNDRCPQYNNCCGDYSFLCTSDSSSVSNSNSCQDKCGAAYDSSLQCQCNDRCSQYNNCCGDYSSLCTSNNGKDCKNFSDVTQELWTKDVDRLASGDVTLNYQSQIDDDDALADVSPQKLFSYVNETQFTSSVYTTFLALLDNYDPVKNTAEDVTEQEKAEEEAFLDAVLATSVFDVVYDYLLCQEKIKDAADLKALLRRIWFGLYPRSGKSTIKDTSAFEHIMVGEFKSSGSASGLHNWIGFYEKEKSQQYADINYYGHSCDVKPNLVCAAYNWEGRKKRLSSFLVNVSPAYDLALYSLCYIIQPGTCTAQIDGQESIIKTYNKDGHIATAFIER